MVFSALYVMPVMGQAKAECEETVVTAAQFEMELPSVTDTVTKYCNANNVNIRLEPNLECEILDQAMINTSFETVLDVGGWTMITTCDGYAYIKSEYLSDEKNEYSNLELLGTFRISHYCCEKYKHICGTGDGLTASGVPVKSGLIAVDPRIIPLGSTIVINENEYTASDTGGQINGHRIDIAVPTHAEALVLGIYEAKVYVKRN